MHVYVPQLKRKVKLKFAPPFAKAIIVQLLLTLLFCRCPVFTYVMDTRITENKLTICKQCSRSIARGDNSVVCEGFCGQAFHAKCVKLSGDDLMRYRKKSNMWWICDACIEQIRAIHNDRLL